MKYGKVHFPGQTALSGGPNDPHIWRGPVIDAAPITSNYLPSLNAEISKLGKITKLPHFDEKPNASVRETKQIAKTPNISMGGTTSTNAKHIGYDSKIPPQRSYVYVEFRQIMSGRAKALTKTDCAVARDHRRRETWVAFLQLPHEAIWRGL